MLSRWNSSLKDLKLFLNALDKLLPFIRRKKQRERPPKHSVRKYLKIIIAKEYKKCSLRDAEHVISRKVCKTRVDHSVIGYWEKKFSKTFIEKIIKHIGKILARFFCFLFTFFDSTKFTKWNKENVELHALVGIGNGFLCPISAFFGSVSPKVVASKILVEGKGKLLADSWYDDNEVFSQAFKKGYEPVIKPNVNRARGYRRRKARKIWNNINNRFFYKQRGRCESIFGSLTNEYGDRLKTLRDEATITRIGARIIAYQVKMFMRIKDCLFFMINI